MSLSAWRYDSATRAPPGRLALAPSVARTANLTVTAGEVRVVAHAVDVPRPLLAPAAIGAQIAHPGSTVVCVSGDASILMNLQELSTAAQHSVPVKLVVTNNSHMGMVRQWQELVHGGRLSHSWTAALPDFVAVARGFGWGAERVEDPAGLDAAIARCLAYPGPYFLDVAVAQLENCFPMIPAGSGHHEVMLDATRRWNGSRVTDDRQSTLVELPVREGCRAAAEPKATGTEAFPTGEHHARRNPGRQVRRR